MISVLKVLRYLGDTGLDTHAHVLALSSLPLASFFTVRLAANLNGLISGPRSYILGIECYQNFANETVVWLKFWKAELPVIGTDQGKHAYAAIGSNPFSNREFSSLWPGFPGHFLGSKNSRRDIGNIPHRVPIGREVWRRHHRPNIRRGVNGGNLLFFFFFKWKASSSTK